MNALSFCGWIVLHSMWITTFIAGLAAVALVCAGEGRAVLRYRISFGALVLMAGGPVVAAIAALDLLGPSTRRPVMMTVDRIVALPEFLLWRSRVLPVLGALWLIGVLICLVRLALASREVSRLRSTGTLRDRGELQGVVMDLAAILSIRKSIDVRRSMLAGVPMVLGWRRPVILLPTTSIEILEAGQLRAILAHELAHVGRSDYASNILQIVADSAMFHHPAARWISRRIRIEREYCCDDTAVSVCRDAAGYARALAALEDSRSGCSLAIAAASGTLLDRVQRIAGRQRRSLTMGRAALMLGLATITSAGMLVVAMVLPQSVPPGAQLRRRQPAGTAMPIAPSESLAPSMKKRSGGPDQSR